MKIEVGKTYKTRTGRTVHIVYAKSNRYMLGIFKDTEDSATWGSDGRWAIITNDLDLIAEDIPTRTYYRAAVYRVGGEYFSGTQWYRSVEEIPEAFDDCEVVEWETRELPDLETKE